jgi:hypothetical protein
MHLLFSFDQGLKSESLNPKIEPLNPMNTNFKVDLWFD